MLMVMDTLDILIFFLLFASGTTSQRQGPIFTIEPPSRVEFLNSTGTAVQCSAQGSPMPQVSWTRADGAGPLADIPGLRHVRGDGTLVFSPFRPDEYRQDVHATVYRCIATNVVGTISSKDISIRAAFMRDYDPQVYDAFVTKGNTAVLKCNVPSIVKDQVSIISWFREDGNTILPDTGGRYTVLPSGELYIRHTDSTDSQRKYFCQTKHRISGEVRRSNSAGRVNVRDMLRSQPPRITHKLPKVVAEKGSTAVLPCAAEGLPVPTISWLRVRNRQLERLSRDGVRQSNGVLYIRKVDPSDAGRYACYVNNTIADMREETELLVTAPLRVNVDPKRPEVKEGDSVTFNCSVIGYPIHSIVWMKNRNPVVVNARTIVSRNQLRIHPVVREDKGMYQCFVRNDFETAQGTAELDLGDDPPQLTQVFLEQTLDPGNFLSLKCSATGIPLPQITWSLDGAPVTEGLRTRVGDFVTNDGFVNSFVNITRLQPEDGGAYECRGSNDIATVSHSARVNIFGPPFVKPMKNVTVLAGSNLVIKCPVSGYPIEKISWEIGGSRLPQNRRQQVFPNGTLIINTADRNSDEGNYRCSAENKEGESSFRDVGVKVLVAPVINPFHFVPGLKEGNRVIVTCSILDGDPPIRLRWYKDGKVLLESANVVVDSSNQFLSTLHIEKAAYDNSGNYTCVASNRADVVNYTAVMVVNVPPSWKIPPSDKSVVAGQNVVIDCQANGFPHPRIWWEKSEAVGPRNYRAIISNAHIHALENGSLMIREAERSDHGFYLCQATNGIGAGLSKVVELTVNVAAYFKGKFIAQTLKKGESGNLFCEAFGEIPINIEWNKDRQPFDPTTDARYELSSERKEESVASRIVIDAVDRRDSALFTCIATNAYGQDDINIQLTVQEPPDSPGNILAELGSRTINIQWTKPYSGNSDITKYKIQYKLPSEMWSEKDRSMVVDRDRSSAILTGLKPNTNYHVRMMALNNVGWGEPSQVVSITTAEEAPTGSPTVVHAVASSSNTIHVSWQPPRKELKHGTIKGYYVGYKPHDGSESYVYKSVEVQGGFKEEVILTNLHRATKYSIIVTAYNDKGRGPSADEVVVETLQSDPPISPNFTIVSVTTSSIQVRWVSTATDSSPVTGFYLYFKKEYEAWEERQASGHQTTYTFQDLYCGSHYQFYIMAYNVAGKGKPSEVVSGKTSGSAPSPPKREVVLSINSTAVSLHLNTWLGGACPVNFFIVQYKVNTQREWILVSNNIVPEQKVLTISDLVPGTWYTVLMTAHSEAGPTEAEYVFATLTSYGATVAPPFGVDERRPLFYRGLSIVIPTACAIIVLVVIIVVACVVVKKRRHLDNPNRRESRFRDDKSGEGVSMSVLDRKQQGGSAGSGSPVKDNQLYYPSPYAMSHVPMFQKQQQQQQGSPDSDCGGHSLRREFGRHEHIYDVPFPPKWREQVDTYSHIMENSNISLHPSTNIYQAPRVIPVHAVRTNTPHHERRSSNKSRNSHRLSYKVSTMASDGQSGDESDNEVSYVFNREVPTSYLDSHEMSEAECDRDLHEFVEKSEKFQIFEQYNGQRICIT